jgi:hypothetical protein
MNSGNFWKVLMFATAAAVVVTLLPDVKRYIRISTM